MCTLLRRVAKCTLMWQIDVRVCVCVCAGRGYLCLILVGIQKIYKYLCTPLAVALKQDPLWPLGKTVLSATPGGCATMFLSHLLSTANVESWTNKNVPQSRGFLKQDTWSQHKMFHLFTWTAPCYPCARRCSSFFVLQHPSVLSDRNVCFVVFSTVFVFSFFFLGFCIARFLFISLTRQKRRTPRKLSI